MKLIVSELTGTSKYLNLQALFKTISTAETKLDSN